MSKQLRKNTISSTKYTLFRTSKHTCTSLISQTLSLQKDRMKFMYDQNSKILVTQWACSILQKDEWLVEFSVSEQKLA